MEKEHTDLIADLSNPHYWQHRSPDEWRALADRAAAAIASLAARCEAAGARVRELEDDARDHHTALQSALFTTPATSDEVASLVRVLRERGQKIEWDGGDVSADQQLLRAADVIERLDRERQECADHTNAVDEECHGLRIRAERAEADRERTQRTLEETVESMGRTIIRVEAERDAAIKDAERYRWLRERLFACDFEYRVDDQTECPMLVFHVPDGFRISSNLDASLDAAIAREGNSNG